VVEDDAAVVEFLEGLLVDNGYEVIQARDGVQAMVALTAPADELPHAILLDLGLPIESGVSVLAFVRNVMKSGLPVIVITGRGDLEEETAVRELGVSAYLRKPTEPGRVLDALSRALA
jgi:DNA-binding response OmpR family regulator